MKKAPAPRERGFGLRWCENGYPAALHRGVVNVKYAKWIPVGACMGRRWGVRPGSVKDSGRRAP